MLISILFKDPLAFFILAAIFVMALSVHEFAHAYLADRFGDPTPRQAGRVTLNPLAHLDPVGTLLLFFANFGWAKPVPINPRYFRHALAEEIQVSLAGPFANLVLAVLVGVFLRFVPTSAFIEQAAALIVVLNLNLMIFNLVPIPPLDGSHFLRAFVSEDVYWRLLLWGPLLILGLVFVGSPILQKLIEATVIPLARLIIGT